MFLLFKKVFNSKYLTTLLKCLSNVISVVCGFALDHLYPLYTTLVLISKSIYSKYYGQSGRNRANLTSYNKKKIEFSLIIHKTINKNIKHKWIKYNHIIIALDSLEHHLIPLLIRSYSFTCVLSCKCTQSHAEDNSSLAVGSQGLLCA